MDAGILDGEHQGAGELDEGDGESFERRACVVSEAGHGTRLDRWLATQVPEFSRSYLQRLIDAGDISLDGQEERQASRRVSLGQVYDLLLRPPPQASAFRPESIALSVIYEDEALMVIDKPTGMVMHPAAGNWSGTVLNGLLAHHAAAATLAQGWDRPSAGQGHQRAVRRWKDAGGDSSAERSDRAQRDQQDLSGDGSRQGADWTGSRLMPRSEGIRWCESAWQ